MDQIVQALGLINSFRIDGLTGSANPTSGARLNLQGGLESLSLTAKDGDDPGIDIHSHGFGIDNLSLPTPQDPAVALDPYLSPIQVDLRAPLYKRLAEFAKESLLEEFYKVINRVVLRRLHTAVRLTSRKIAHVDITLDHVHLQCDAEELIRVKDLSVSILDYNTKLPPKEAQKACRVVLRSLTVEIEQAFFEKVLEASKPKIPPFVKNLHVELPGPKMIVGGNIDRATRVMTTAIALETSKGDLPLALALVARRLDLPREGAVDLLMLGRLTGLMGHVLDQAIGGSPIRTRLRYVGPTPGAN